MGVIVPGRSWGGSLVLKHYCSHQIRNVGWKIFRLDIHAHKQEMVIREVISLFLNKEK